MVNLPANLHITYQLQFRKCGKPTCGTCKHGMGHGPYWYAYWREGHKLHSGYIGKNRPANVPATILARAEARAMARQRGSVSTRSLPQASMAHLAAQTA